MTATKLEQRLAAVEREVARLKRERAGSSTHPVQALEQIHGTFENDQAFAEAARLGRKWRNAQRPRKRAAGK
jgi:hypothetical protein